MSDPKPSPGPSPSRSLRPIETRTLLNDTLIATLVRWGLVIAAVATLLLVSAYLATILWPAVIAIAIAYLLDPVLEKLVERGMSRGGAARVLLVGFSLLLAGAIMVLIIFVPGQIASFYDRLPEMIDEADRLARSWFGFELRSHLNAAEIQGVVENTFGPVDKLAAVALSGALALVALVIELLLALLFTYYLLVEWPTVTAGVMRMVPPRRRTWAREVLGDIDSVVSGWVRGQAIVTSLLAVLYAIAFWIIGVPLAIPLGLVVGLLTVIPFIGTFVGVGVTGVVLGLDWPGGGVVGAVAAVFVVLHILEAAVLTPKIVGHKVGLSESAALFAVLAGGKLLGLVGIILAVPLAATVAVLLRHAVRHYERTEFFGDEDDAIVPVPPAMALMMTDEVAGGTVRVERGGGDGDASGKG